MMGCTVFTKSGIGETCSRGRGAASRRHFINNFGATGAADAKPRKIKKYAFGGGQNSSPLGQKEEVGQAKMTYAVSLALIDSGG
jgi:hypothetical protein